LQKQWLPMFVRVHLYSPLDYAIGVAWESDELGAKVLRTLAYYAAESGVQPIEPCFVESRSLPRAKRQKLDIVETVEQANPKHLRKVVLLEEQGSLAWKRDILGGSGRYMIKRHTTLSTSFMDRLLLRTVSNREDKKRRSLEIYRDFEFMVDAIIGRRPELYEEIRDVKSFSGRTTL
jgi:hypothetical protein